MTSPTSNRREFLIGRAAMKALESLGDAGRQEAGIAAAPRQTLLLEVTRQAMACEFQVILNAGQDAVAVEQAIDVLDLVERLEQQLTIFRDSSEISRLNARAAEQPVALEPRLYALLQHAHQLYQQTGGAFDITAGPLARIWGFVRRQGRMPSAEEVAAAKQRVGSQHLRFDDQQHTVQFALAGMEINLGAIGKGYALDRCAERLLAAGVNDFLLHGGQSSILAHGDTRGESGWLVGVRDPLRPERRIAAIRLHDRALGTSGTANQFFYHQGQRYGHIMDPRTGQPAQELLATTVLATTAAEADAFATALFVMGRQDSLAFCESRSDIAAILISPGPYPGELHVDTIGVAEEDWRVLD